MYKVLLLASLSLAASISLAAPIPATSSSSFLKTSLGMFRSHHGFSIHAGNTSWLHTPPPKGNKYIQTIYKAPIHHKGVQAALTVRVDKLHRESSVKGYMKKWIKEYPRLGFTILNSQKVRVKKNTGFLLDLVNKKSNKQLRQVVFVKGYLAIILTCRDHKATFNSTVKSCNQIIKNFQWL